MKPEKTTVFIVVKTYPALSSKYDELVCTAGVTDKGKLKKAVYERRESDYAGSAETARPCLNNGLKKGLFFLKIP